MLVKDFIAKLKLAHDVPNYYNNHFPYNCGVDIMMERGSVLTVGI